VVYRVRTAILISFVCGALAGLGGCDAETPSPASTGPSAELSTPSAAAIQDYCTELNNWAEKYFTNADLNAFNFQNPLSPTKGELGRAKDFTAYAHSMLGELRTIDPPPELAQPHHEYVDSIASEIAALDRLLSGIESGNRHDIELAYRYVSAAHAQELRALHALGPYIDLPALTKS
jgi:hypothetical protein